MHAVAVQRGTVHVPSRSTPSHSSCTVARTWQYTGVSRLHRLHLVRISDVSRPYLRRQPQQRGGAALLRVQSLATADAGA